LFKKKLFVLRSSSGWWSRYVLKYNEKKLEMLKIPPGNNVVDCLNVISPFAKKIIWLGYCGSLNNDEKIGNLVIPNSAIKPYGKNLISLGSNNNLKIICQTDGVVKSQYFYERLKNKGVFYVDMESWSVFSFAKKNKIFLKYILVVSDIPTIKPVYYLNQKHFKTIDKAVLKTVELVKKFI